MKITVRCGTRRPELFEVDLDRYGESRKTNATEEIQKRALNFLHSTMNFDHFADDGYRNNSAVNGCIALHVLGYDAESWFENFCAEQGANKERWIQYDLDKFMEHVERVAPYLKRWGPEGNESLALNYTIV